MNKKYYHSLTDEVVKQRYSDKIRLCQGIDPYCLNEKDLSTDPSDCPMVSYYHLADYLINAKSPYTMESFKAHKSLDAFKFFEAGWVQQVWIKKIPDILSTIVIGKVHHSQRLNEKDLFPWVLCQDDGEIICANCTCIAGLGEVCSHAGAVLFAIEWTVRNKNPKSVTEISAGWPVPPVKNLECLEIRNVDWRKKIKPKAIPAKMKCLEHLSLSPDDIVDLLSNIEDNGGSSALSAITPAFFEKYSTVKKWDTVKSKFQTNPNIIECEASGSGQSSSSSGQFESYSNNIECEASGSGQSLLVRESSSKFLDIESNMDPQTSAVHQNPYNDKLYEKIARHFYSNLFQEKYKYLNLTDLQKITESLDLKIVDSDIIFIKWFTKNQNDSPHWFKLREGRITASIFKRCCITKIAKPSLCLIKAICYPRNFSTEATKYGIQNESNALSSFQNLMESKHQNLVIKNCGLILSNDFPGLGASPDGLMTCDCHEDAVIEIKCPFTWKDGGDKDILLKMKDPFLKLNEGGELELNKKHSYYYQVQMQLYLAKASICYFVVWCKEEFITLGIYPCEDFWNENSKKAMDFQKLVILPEMLGKYFTKK